VAGLNVRDLIAAGIHFGHRASRWNPKMAPYIYGKRNLIHIIDIKETIKGIVRAKKFLTQVIAEGKDVVFVATKRQAKAIVETEAKRANMPFVSERWLGGMLTNFRTVRERLKYLEQLEALESSGEMQTYSKKMISKLNREMGKIRRNLNGVRTMNRLPGAVFVIDPRRECIAVREARRLGIPTVALMDTDSDPDDVDLVIPGNDDAMRSIEAVLSQMADAVLEGLANRAKRPMTADRAQEVAPDTMPTRRPRGRRAGGRGAGGPGGPGGSKPAGRGGTGGRGGRGGGRGGRRDAGPTGPDPMQLAERGAPHPVAKPADEKPAEEKPAEATDAAVEEVKSAEGAPQAAEVTAAAAAEQAPATDTAPAVDETAKAETPAPAADAAPAAEEVKEEPKAEAPVADAAPVEEANEKPNAEAPVADTAPAEEAAAKEEKPKAAPADDTAPAAGDAEAKPDA
jgi:small subunit ribosomal protein S2